jgi:hypothetical protein
MQSKPRVFIGSSVEGLSIAEHIQLGLDYHAECTLWSQGVFGLSGGTLESLLRAVKEFDFAVLALTPDDLVQKRSVSRNSPRDNVLFELGLFMGALGRERTYIVHCRDVLIDLPTDLAGVTAASFAKRTDGNLQAALGPVCTQLKTAMAAASQARPDAISVSGENHASTLLVELSSLKAEFVAQRDSIHRMLESIISGPISGPSSWKKLDSTDDGLRSFEGIWRAPEEDTTYYVRHWEGKLRCIYCYQGDINPPSGEYYDWKLMDRTMLARFRWFKGGLSGYAYLHVESEERLTGGWWLSEAFDAEILKTTPMKISGGTAMTWLRQPTSAVAPDWVEVTFQRLQNEQRGNSRVGKRLVNG